MTERCSLFKIGQNGEDILLIIWIIWDVISQCLYAGGKKDDKSGQL